MGSPFLERSEHGGGKGIVFEDVPLEGQHAVFEGLGVYLVRWRIPLLQRLCRAGSESTMWHRHDTSHRLSAEELMP